MADKTFNSGVTIAKAIAIILMVLGHSGCPDAVNHFLGLMRMPLFFLMSGYCFKAKYLTDGGKYLRRRVTGVYVPCVKWGLIFLLLHNAFCYVGLYNAEYGANPDTASPYSLGVTAHSCATMLLTLVPNEELIGGYWFLHDLFFGSLIFYFMLRLLRKTYVTIPLLLVLTMLMSYRGIELYYFIYPRTVFASFFITVGYAYKEARLHLEQTWGYILSSILVIAIVSTQWHSNFLEFGCTDVIPFAIFAVMGSLMIFGVGERMSEMRESRLKSFFMYVGGKTFNVLTWHMLSFKLVSLAIILIYSLPWNQIAGFPVIAEYASRGWFPVYFVIGVIVPIAWSYWYDKVKNKVNSE